MLIEACVESITDAIAAVHAGADRIELCSNLSEGGITPSVGLIRRAAQSLQIPVFVMIRPRGGDSVYSAAEVDVMRDDIEAAKSAGVQGVVLGALDERGGINRGTMSVLMKTASPLPVTFHRAFDQARDLDEALAVCLELGISRILTSGGCMRAIDAVDTLRRLQTNAGTQLIIMAGGGVRADNICQIIDRASVQEVHLGPRCMATRSQPVQNGDPRSGASLLFSGNRQCLDIAALTAAIRVARIQR